MRAWMCLSILVLSAVAFPLAIRAQIGLHPCCDTCQQPVVQCHCLRTRPVVQTHLREEKVTTYRDVCETRYRQECLMEQTPVTTYEDRVETVWVPQQVTRKVARTVMVPQAKARTVPYQVMQRIPQTTTRLVPYQTVHHVTEAVPLAYGGPVIGHAWSVAPAISATPAAQTAAAIPHRAPPLVPSAGNSSGWQTIPARSATPDRTGGYEADYERPVPTPIDEEPAVRKSSWRGNVPAAVSARNFSERTFR